MSATALILAAGAIVLLIVQYALCLHRGRRAVRIQTQHIVRDPVTGVRRTVMQERAFPQPPGPMPWPIVGNLVTLGKYDVPFVGLTALAKQFGDCYSLTLGSTRCLVVNNLQLIREVLNQNGKFFGGRPDFLRFHTLFGGDRSNSLALCDWTNLQQKRRNLARKHCSPRDTSAYYAKMSEVGCQEMNEFMERMRRDVPDGQDYHIKPLVQRTCANMFSQYMCSMRFDYDDEQFQEITKCFDDIFWEINQGYALDFLPWLAPFYGGHLRQIVAWSTKIRTFILDRIVGDRESYVDLEEPEKDFTDALLRSLLEDPDVQRDTIIYMLEDFLGGHSAIGNLVMLCLAYVVRYPEVGIRIQQEVDALTRNVDSAATPRKVTLFDTDAMPYTVATIFEVLRFSSSPIVPHVATENATISGFGITKGTMVFINNYDLNTSAEYWDEPTAFRPERFLEWVPACTMNSNATTAASPTTTNNKIHATLDKTGDSGVDSDAQSDGGSDEADMKVEGNNNVTLANDHDDDDVLMLSERESNAKRVLRVKRNIPHFLPFSIGKRTCIGQNLVKGFTFIMLANIMQTYDVSISDPSLIKLYPACVAVPADTFPLALSLRE